MTNEELHDSVQQKIAGAISELQSHSQWKQVDDLETLGYDLGLTDGEREYIHDTPEVVNNIGNKLTEEL